MVLSHIEQLCCSESRNGVAVSEVGMILGKHVQTSLCRQRIRAPLEQHIAYPLWCRTLPCCVIRLVPYCFDSVRVLHAVCYTQAQHRFDKQGNAAMDQARVMKHSLSAICSILMMTCTLYNNFERCLRESGGCIGNIWGLLGWKLGMRVASWAIICAL